MPKKTKNKKYVLAICGSPRKGNTEFMLKTILSSVKGKKELILLRKKKIHFCADCANERCKIKDDSQQILKKMKNADLIVFGSPSYWDNVSGLMKTFFDATTPLWFKREIKGKPAIAVAVGEMTERKAADRIVDFCKGHEMKVIEVYCARSELFKNPIEKKRIIDELKKIGKSI